MVEINILELNNIKITSRNLDLVANVIAISVEIVLRN